MTDVVAQAMLILAVVALEAFAIALIVAPEALWRTMRGAVSSIGARSQRHVGRSRPQRGSVPRDQGARA